eukprot:maker-scaffold1811_size27320-snap-gene-0.12 protein:Tk00379 transcript:maker-scaffold1811_size27320-snap-gene-0.12-mRNA-1 annotation:"circumsporozoite protein c14"
MMIYCCGDQIQVSTLDTILVKQRLKWSKKPSTALNMREKHLVYSHRMLTANCWVHISSIGFLLLALGACCSGFQVDSSEEDPSLPFLSFLFNSDVNRRSGNPFGRGRSLGSEFLGKRAPGSEFLGKRVPGSEFLGKRAPGSEFLGKRVPGSEFLGKRVPGSEFLGKRVPGSEFLGKRAPGSEFLGKRAPGSEFLGKRAPGSEFLGKRGQGELDDEDLRAYFARELAKRTPEVPVGSGQSDRDLHWERVQAMLSS